MQKSWKQAYMDYEMVLVETLIWVGLWEFINAIIEKYISFFESKLLIYLLLIVFGSILYILLSQRISENMC